ncbi:MAG TPA: HAD hydrolase family protein [Candidatus Thermoplasmatota archaeon]|nr:HAD hydrolase family protein [Candidatus Thermoplasmatota archaeon]
MPSPEVLRAPTDASGPSPPSAAAVRALATDLDRTLTDADLVLVPRVLDALARARAAGGRVVVVSGRDLPFLRSHVGHVADAIVAENGAILLLPQGAPRRLGPSVDVQGALARLAVPLERGEVLASADVEHEELLRATLVQAGIDATLIRNRDRVMVLPRGVDKALGVLAALDALGVAPEHAAAAGDGENDVPLLASVGYRVAVGNAVPELKAIAAHVPSQYGGEGLADWIEGCWIPALEAAR